MGYHRLPPQAIRIGLNRGFESAWCADKQHYAKILQKDWLLSRAVWGFVQRSSRTLPRAQLTKEQQLQQLASQRRAMEGGEAAAAASSKAPVASGQQQGGLRDYPNFRMGRVFMQHLPYKTYASTFAYMSPKEGPQAKYGLFPSRFRRG